MDVLPARDVWMSELALPACLLSHWTSLIFFVRGVFPSFSFGLLQKQRADQSRG